MEYFPRHPLATNTSGIKFASEPTANQRTIIAAFVKKAGLQVLQGADLTKISLPIQVFEPRTFLERLPLDLLHAPRLLNLAAAASTDVERFQLCVAVMISGRNTTACSADKPLNPCLGETYQGIFDDGSRVFVEQVAAAHSRALSALCSCTLALCPRFAHARGKVSHHPPATSCLLEGASGAWQVLVHSVVVTTIATTVNIIATTINSLSSPSSPPPPSLLSSPPSPTPSGPRPRRLPRRCQRHGRAHTL